MTNELGDLGTPNCPVHLVSMELVGDRPDGSDARWVCPTPDCRVVAIA